MATTQCPSKARRAKISKLQHSLTCNSRASHSRRRIVLRKSWHQRTIFQRGIGAYQLIMTASTDWFSVLEGTRCQDDSLLRAYRYQMPRQSIYSVLPVLKCALHAVHFVIRGSFKERAEAKIKTLRCHIRGGEKQGPWS